MNDTNLSNWTVDSSNERSFSAPATFTNHSFLFTNSKSPKSPQKTHRPSMSYHSKHSKHSKHSTHSNNIHSMDTMYESKEIELNDDKHDNQNYEIKNNENNHINPSLINHQLQNKNSANLQKIQSPKAPNPSKSEIELPSSNIMISKQPHSQRSTNSSSHEESGETTETSNIDAFYINTDIDGIQTFLSNQHEHKSLSTNTTETVTYVNKWVNPIDIDREQQLTQIHAEFAPQSMNIKISPKRVPNSVIDDEKEKEEEENVMLATEHKLDDITSMASSGCTVQKSNNSQITNQVLQETMSYTSKLMKSIQRMNDQQELEYKVEKYAKKIRKLQHELSGEKTLHRQTAQNLDKVSTELTQTNMEIDRMEREKRDLKVQLKKLEDVQQQYRILQMKHLQLQQEQKLKIAEVNKLNKELIGMKDKLQRTLEDRENISNVSEIMREELTNKKVRVNRLKEINKELTEKLNKVKLERNNHQRMMSDTMYTAPDATKLYHQMDDLEHHTKWIQQIKDLEERLQDQSRQFHRLKLENQSLKQKNLKLQRDNNVYSDKLKVVRNELKSIKVNKDDNIKQLDKKCKCLQQELRKKDDDIEKLKSAVSSLNGYIRNQKSPKSSPMNATVAHEDNDEAMNKKMARRNSKGNIIADRINTVNLHNMTSLSFPHDLDLEVDHEDDMEVESVTKHKKVTSLTSASSGDLLDDITAVIKNQKRSRNSLGMKSRNKMKIAPKKYSKNAKKTVTRHFLPSHSNPSSNNNNNNNINNNHNNSRARRITLHKQHRKNIDTNNVQLARV